LNTIEEELSKVKSSGILDLSPENEVEAELVYLQSKLLDNAVDSRKACGNMILLFI
jgi:hypothetical protein